MTQPPHPRRSRTRRARLGAAALAATLTGGLFVAAQPATYAAPQDAEGLPTLSPADGAYLEGDVTVAAEPTVAGDDVTGLAIGDDQLAGAPTVGASQLRFDVGSNSTEARYGNHVIVNGTHRIDLGDAVNETVTLEIPNEHLVAGENTVEVVAGIIETSCGMNHDDFVLSNFELELLGETADGDANEFSYAFGDGSCGTNTSLLLRAELSFVVAGDPQGTTGLTTDVDTTTLTNGTHQVVATTASGRSVTHTVTVNNAPAGAPYITPVDGTLTSGTQPVFAAFAAGAGGAVPALSVDGAEQPVRETLGSGLAVVSFDVGSNSIEARYGNHLLINGMKADIGGDFVSERVDVTIPNEWLTPGSNTIDLVTGTFETSCGANRDDFAVSAITLTPAEGAATAQGQEASYSMGDGSCGSSATALREVDLHFLVDAPARGVRADVDTAALADGEHTVAATSTTGETATRVLVTDNTAPEVVVSTPAPGETITSSVLLDVEVDDASGVLSGPQIALDGEPIALGDPVGPGLSSGEHTLAVTSTDVLGNTAIREIVFASAGIPDAPAELTPAPGATDVGDAATLSARVAEPDGGDVTATFSQAEVFAADTAWQGTAPSVPATLQVPGERPVPTGSLAPLDGETLDAPAGHDVTFQRYDIRVRGPVDSSVLRWEGVIDPQRLATLHVWDLENETWDAVANARGAVEGNTVLTASVGPEYVDRSRVHIMVTGQDPFADDMDPGDPEGFADPSSYDFSIAHFTDTQYLAEGAVEQETAEERSVWASAYAGVVEWIAENAADRKIAYAAHTGDIIENNARVPADDAMREQVVGEFELASELQRVLDDAGVPNGVIAGNHDNQTGTENGAEAIYNEYFGPGRYAAAAEQWEDAEYGGPWREGDNQNHYDLFTAGGLDFVVVGLSYGVTREEVEWANSIFDRFSDRNGILLAHDYLAPSTNPDGRGAGFSAPDGAVLYQQVVDTNPNVFLVLSGHENGVGTNVKPSVGEPGHGVVELLADYQFYTVTADRLGLTEVGGYLPTDELRFGSSFFRLLQFDVDRSEMIVDTYSPLLGEFGATEYDANGRYNGLEDNMVLPVDLNTRTTSFQTDSLALYTPTQVIGEATVASGEVAEVAWDGLTPSTAYAWIVTARSTSGGVTVSQPSVFTTVDAQGQPGTWDSESPLWRYFEPLTSPETEPSP